MHTHVHTKRSSGCSHFKDVAHNGYGKSAECQHFPGTPPLPQGPQAMPQGTRAVPPGSWLMEVGHHNATVLRLCFILHKSALGTAINSRIDHVHPCMLGARSFVPDQRKVGGVPGILCGWGHEKHGVTCACSIVIMSFDRMAKYGHMIVWRSMTIQLIVLSMMGNS